MKIWDLPTRLYHWIQATLFICLITGFGPHLQLGLALFTLICWRLVWGFIGSDTSKFKNFVSSPTRTVRYLLGKESSHAGHNPAGAWMVIALIATLFVQCFTGMALVGLFNSFPYAESLLSENTLDVFRAIHRTSAQLLIVFVVIHLSAIVIYKLRSKPLVKAMITGKQDSLPQKELAPVAFASNQRALLVLIISSLVTLLILKSG